ncbi:hypothetical protein [Bacillus cereus]|uniref:hypothetical protein n=1 Tax=Bacillus cereus TaxID=1396 RepID=UPI0006658733|nr:hypothetical protein [Bacillus cereus]
MSIFVINIILLFLLVIIYFVMKKKMGESILFDVSIIYKYLFLYSPVVIFIVNIIFTYILKKEAMLYSLLPLLVPFLYYVYRGKVNIQGEREYSELEDIIIPMVLQEFKKRNINIQHGQISIRISDKEEKGKKKYLNVVLHLPETNQQIVEIKNIIFKEVKMMFQSRYITKVTVREPYKKKNSVKYILN